MLVFACPHCGKEQTVSATLVDGKARCADCGQFVPVPRTYSVNDATEATVALDPSKKPPPQEPGTATVPDLCDFLAPAQGPGELGRLGSYRVLKILGSGGMGVVFLAEDMDLQRAVALKCLLPTLAVTTQARQRFLREARSAAAIEHDNIVVIYRVGEERGLPYLAMQLLQGEPLDDRLHRLGKLPVAEVLRIGREIAKGLAAAHDRGLIHRDIKPANVWLEGPQGRVKLLDFGLARAVAEDAQVTHPGTIVGTPAYMAPEQAAGKPVDARADLFSLGCVMYQMSTGQRPFQGINTISVLLAVANQQPDPPRELNAELPPLLSDLILQLLGKHPAERPATAAAVAERIAAIEQAPDSPAASGVAPTVITKKPGGLATQSMPTRSDSTEKTLRGGEAPSAAPEKPRHHWGLLAGIAAAAIAVAGIALLVPPLLHRPGDDQHPPDTRSGGPGDTLASKVVTIGIAYGTEKKNWLTSAVRQFAQTPEGKNITINLIPKGSIEGADAIWKDEDPKIHVWAPASSLFRGTLVQRWQKKHGKSPILKEESLALSPVVFVFWEERYQALLKKYGTISFATVARALHEEGGWGTIAGKPDWGQFKFSHTDPAKSNSGLMTLVMMAHEFHHKFTQLTLADVTDAAFQKWVRDFEKGLGPLSHSTGALMEDMVRRGPASFDGVFVYESVVIDYFKQAQGRWGKLHVVYPQQNLWSDAPYYILDVPWSSPAQRQAAEAFLRFLMSEPLQREALAHGFRPGDINIPVVGIADSPFVLYKDAGLQVDPKAIVQPPGGAVIEQLLRFWETVRE
jgi:serine/threonine protein kinase/ABC-type Fe3+ transport system substrate-binding protein